MLQELKAHLLYRQLMRLHRLSPAMLKTNLPTTITKVKVILATIKTTSMAKMKTFLTEITTEDRVPETMNLNNQNRS